MKDGVELDVALDVEWIEVWRRALFAACRCDGCLYLCGIRSLAPLGSILAPFGSALAPLGQP